MRELAVGLQHFPLLRRYEFEHRQNQLRISVRRKLFGKPPWESHPSTMRRLRWHCPGREKMLPKAFPWFGLAPVALHAWRRIWNRSFGHRSTRHETFRSFENGLRVVRFVRLRSHRDCWSCPAAPEWYSLQGRVAPRGCRPAEDRNAEPHQFWAPPPIVAQRRLKRKWRVLSRISRSSTLTGNQGMILLEIHRRRGAALLHHLSAHRCRDLAH